MTRPLLRTPWFIQSSRRMIDRRWSKLRRPMNDGRFRWSTSSKRGPPSRRAVTDPSAPAQEPLQRNATPSSPPTPSTPSTATSMVAVRRASAPPSATQAEGSQSERELPSPARRRPTVPPSTPPSCLGSARASPCSLRRSLRSTTDPRVNRRRCGRWHRCSGRLSRTVSSATQFGPSSPLAMLRAIDVAPSTPQAPPHASVGAHHSTNPHVDGTVAEAQSGPPPRGDSTPIQRDHIGGPVIPPSSSFVPTAEPPLHPVAHPRSATNARMSDVAAQRIRHPSRRICRNRAPQFAAGPPSSGSRTSLRRREPSTGRPAQNRRSTISWQNTHARCRNRARARSSRSQSSEPNCRWYRTLRRPTNCTQPRGTGRGTPLRCNGWRREAVWWCCRRSAAPVPHQTVQARRLPLLRGQ